MNQKTTERLLERFHMMLDNQSYNKVKLLCYMSKMLWFIKKHGIKDAEEAGDQAAIAMLTALEADLSRHCEKLQRLLCIVPQ